MSNVDRFYYVDSSVQCWWETVGNQGEAHHREAVQWFRRRGWKMLKDQRWSALKIHRGIFKGLEVYIHASGRHMEIQFFQNMANVSNPYGGEHDFNKLERMPYLIRLRFLKERAAIAKMVESWGLVNTTETKPTDALQRIANERAASWHARIYRDWPKNVPVNNRRDMQGRLLNDGDTRWCYDPFGSRKLLRGEVYYNLNNMWFLVVNKTIIRNVGSYELFTCDPADMPRRYVPVGARIRKLEELMAKAAGAQDFEAAIRYRDALKRIQSSPALPFHEFIRILAS